MKRSWPALLLVSALLTGCGLPADSPTPEAPSSVPRATLLDTPSPTASPSTASPSPGTVTCAYRIGGEQSRPADPPSGSNVPATGTVTLTLKTNEGDVRLTLDRAKAPCAVNSLENLARQDFFDNTTCHRLYDNAIFAMQCGDPSATGKGGPGYTFDDELSSHGGLYAVGTVMMVNQGPNTNGSQFLLVYSDSPIPGDYTIMGSMDRASIDVVGTIAAEGEDGSFASQGGGGVPNNPAQIFDVVLG